MSSASTGNAGLWQHPYVDVFKHFKVAPNGEGARNDAEDEGFFEMENWQLTLYNDSNSREIRDPQFEPDHAFVSKNGKYYRIREEDEEQKPCAAASPFET